jgi:hypothetical protein
LTLCRPANICTAKDRHTKSMMDGIRNFFIELSPFS